MGEVYRATDTNLKRQVAIKVLPVSVATDADRLARFQREAEVLAALNHPNIAQIFGLEKSGGTIALAMELVEGPTLADRIAQGAIPIDEALPIAKQIAEALEAAHEQGIIHRDLKPANIKVRPDGTVKVLDFGLAKALAGQEPPLENVAGSPTRTSPVALTQMGVLLGTAAYMAPEQARGRTVNDRADIWAFGCVLFEMLGGRAPFAGESVTDVLAQVIERDPDWSALPRSTPPALRRLLRRCLEKNVKRRLAAIADARLDLDEAATSSSADVEAASASGRVRSVSPSMRVAFVGLMLIAAISAWGWFRAARVASPVPATGAYVAATLGVSVPDLAALTDRFAVSPDGTMLAIVDGNRGGLILRRTSGLELSPIAGTPADANAPVFSPDGKWIAFRTERALMKIPVGGGNPARIAEGNDYFANLTWSADDRIRYPALYNEAIRSVSANGGPVETIAFPPLTWVNRAAGLPNGRLLVSLMTGGESQVAVREPDGTLRTLVAGWDGRVAPTGHLLFSRQEGPAWSVVAAPFDENTATLTGDVQVLARDVPVRYATPAAAGATGDLFYIAGTPRSDRRVVIVDRAGAERDVPLPPGAWVRQSISADGRQLALERWEGARRTIWTLTLDTGALTQVTYLDDTFSSRWMADGKHIVFTQFPIDPALRATSVWSVLTDGRGNIQPVPAQWDAYPSADSSDGRTLYLPCLPIRSGPGRHRVRCDWRRRGQALRAARDACVGGAASSLSGRPVARLSDQRVRQGRGTPRAIHGPDCICPGFDPRRQPHSLESGRLQVLLHRRRCHHRRGHRATRPGVDVETSRFLGAARLARPSGRHARWRARRHDPRRAHLLRHHRHSGRADGRERPMTGLRLSALARWIRSRRSPGAILNARRFSSHFRGPQAPANQLRESSSGRLSDTEVSSPAKVSSLDS